METLKASFVGLGGGQGGGLLEPSKDRFALSSQIAIPDKAKVHS